MKLSKKAVASIVYMIIIGFLLFVMVSCAIGNGAIKAFKSYKGAEQSFGDLTTALSDVSSKSNNIAVQLVQLEMEENTALFIFTKDNDLLLSFMADKSPGEQMLIEKPTQCLYDKQCVCLCKDFDLRMSIETNTADELNAKYAGKYPGVAPADIFNVKCGKEIECKQQDDFAIPNRLTLEEIFSDEEIDRIENDAKQMNNGRRQNYIYLWEGGFVLWRWSTSDSAQKYNTQSVFQSNQFMSTKYRDLYVVNNNVNVKICLDPKCGQIKNN